MSGPDSHTDACAAQQKQQQQHVGALYNAALQRLCSDPAWRALHMCIGDRLLSRLLTSCSVFALTDGTTYLQLSGCPLSIIAKQHNKVKFSRTSAPSVNNPGGTFVKPYRWALHKHMQLQRGHRTASCASTPTLQVHKSTLLFYAGCEEATPRSGDVAAPRAAPPPEAPDTIRCRLYHARAVQA
jgi:hypothetical protein